MLTRSQYKKTRFETKGWEREEHFHFFKGFEQPFFNVHTEVEITNLFHYCKKHKLSVFLAYMHAATQGVLKTDNFLLRLEGNEVVKYEAADISTTVLTDRKTVSFVHLPHHPDLQAFSKEASEIVAEAKQGSKLFYGYNGPDLIHATTLPWFKFNGMEHAHMGDANDAIPKLAFGKLEVQAEKVVLPLSVRVHHALADGYHIHLFLKHMEESINSLV
ncbi:CatA-like O-acetyltransferase [Pontibacter korlensis]|uniref:CatA-like O-acetyltransferase n=1 Tax=Pontibacter korlensis TaxID=400092 RepID=UPI00061ACBC9|nr:CatA-like O-acetyltransferase [Pontibacter korlensis]